MTSACRCFGNPVRRYCNLSQTNAVQQQSFLHLFPCCFFIVNIDYVSEISKKVLNSRHKSEFARENKEKNVFFAGKLISISPNQAENHSFWRE